MKKFGVDISHWQGNFDFAKAKKEGVEFAVIKAGGSDSTSPYVDSMFVRNYDEAKKNNLPVGAYWYSKALSVAQAERDAKFMVEKCLKGRQFELPIYIDVEDAEQFKLSTAETTAIVMAFCEYVEKNGYFVGIYSGKYAFQSELNDSKLKKYTHWIAQWASACTYAGTYDMWQFGGNVNKIRSNMICGQVVDQNYMYKDFPTIIKNAGLNGFPKKPKNDASEWAKEAVDWAVANGLIQGDENGDLKLKENVTTERFLTILHRFSKIK